MPIRVFPPVAFALFLATCSPAPPKAPVIGEAYVGPATLNLRKDLAVRAPVTATARHGERLEILAWRRRFAKVRSPAGVEGWTDGRQLLTTRQMARLRELTVRSRELPTHGRATVSDPLNVHTEPNRQSPSFFQIPENGSVEVIRHAMVPRVAFEPPRPAPSQPVRRPVPKLRKPPGGVEPPPAPAPPKPPDNWLDLSRNHLPPVTGIRNDDWTLARIDDGRAGWVLTRPLIMSIPDEVAQYAEGHRITSYFSLGEVDHRGERKKHWLWTTLSAGLQPHQFDSVRIFVWSTRRRHYETAYIERGLRGYFPVEVHKLEAGQTAPEFSLIVQNKDGTFTRRTYAFQGYHVRMIRKEPWQIPVDDLTQGPEAPPAAPAPAADKTLLTRVTETIRGWSRAVLGN